MVSLWGSTYEIRPHTKKLREGRDSGWWLPRVGGGDLTEQGPREWTSVTTHLVFLLGGGITDATTTDGWTEREARQWLCKRGPGPRTDQ